MPYIKQEKRRKFDIILEDVPSFENKGELEYCIYYLMTLYSKERDFTYTNLSDCTYAAQHCADEFRRRNLDVRENEARETNGDVIIPGA